MFLLDKLCLGFLLLLYEKVKVHEVKKCRTVFIYNWVFNCSVFWVERTVNGHRLFSHTTPSIITINYHQQANSYKLETETKPRRHDFTERNAFFRFAVRSDKEPNAGRHEILQSARDVSPGAWIPYKLLVIWIALLE